MAYTLGLLLWVIQHAVKPMLAFRIEALTDLCRLSLELAPFGAWSDYLLSYDFLSISVSVLHFAHLPFTSQCASHDNFDLFDVS